MNPINIDIYDNGTISMRARARNLAEFREQMAELRRLGAE